MTSSGQGQVSAFARDLDDYVVQYRTLPFEATQAAFRRQRVLTQVRHHSPRRLLEVGCGEAPLFTELPDTEATVVEPAGPFAEHARQLAEGRTSVVVIQDYVEHLDPARVAAGFDMAVVGCLLHEVPDPQVLLRAVRRLCTPTAVLHISVPNSQSLHRRLAAAMGMVADPSAASATQRRMQQRTFYDPASLVRELHQAGLVVRDSGSILVKPFTHAQMQGLVDAGLLTPQMLAGFDRLAQDLPDLGSELWVDAEAARG